MFNRHALLLIALVATGCQAPDSPPPSEPPPPLELAPGEYPTPEELLLTPRPDVRAEMVALAIDSDHWVATTSTYERVSSDFAAIETQISPLFTPIRNASQLYRFTGVLFGYDPNDAVDDATTLTQAGQATSFLNAALNEYDSRPEIVRMTGSWSGVLQPELVLNLFRSIAGVLFALPGTEEAPIDGSTIRVESFTIDGPATYLIVGRSGDCAEGCTEVRAARIIVENGVAQQLETYDSEDGQECPTWLCTP